jgi:hypothetical protein
MQTLGRVAIVGGGIAVSLVNILMFSGASTMAPAEQVAVYMDIYWMALSIPVLSICGVIAAPLLKQRQVRRLRRAGGPAAVPRELQEPHEATPRANWWLLGGSLAFVLFTLGIGLSHAPFDQEIIFAGSLAIVIFLMAKLVQALSPPARRTLVGIAVVIFVFRALPGPGAGSTWWQIDILGFDQQFLSTLALLGNILALAGMFLFRRFMAEKSIVAVVGFLTIAGTLLTMPYLGMYYGLHEWTAALTHGVVDARVIALVDTTLESPLGQVAMIPMLAWIANSAPAQLKATFFAVMASFTNLALSLSQLGTKHLNQLFMVTREVRDPGTGAIMVPADYSALGALLITVTVIGLLAPLLTIWLVQKIWLQR